MAKYDYGGGCPCGLQKECEPGCEYYNRELNKMKENDFGFTFADSNELSAEVDTATQKLEKLRAMIMPFLNNLKKNPEKDMIKWPGPDRVKSIDDFIVRINQLVDN